MRSILALSFLAALTWPAALLAAPAGPEIPTAQRAKIGRAIWKNECAGTVDGLTTWNEGEAFLSLGIGHTIWFPKGANERFTETFPLLVKSMQQQGIRCPEAVLPPKPCPWPDRATFIREKNGPLAREIRQWLADTVVAQTDYLIARQQAALPKMLAACPPGDRPAVKSRFDTLSTTPEGLFCLIDYVNFKGEGINPSERYQGTGWGLLQVLQEMRGTPAGAAAVREFAASADRTLTRRVLLSPPARNEKRWLAGWRNRVYRYPNPF